MFNVRNRRLKVAVAPVRCGETRDRLRSAAPLCLAAVALAGCSDAKSSGDRETRSPVTTAAATAPPGPSCDLLEPGANFGYQLCQDPNNPADRGRIEFRGRGRIPIEYPYMGPAGHWADGFVSRDGKTLLLQWTAECEVPFAFFVPAAGGKPRLVTGERRVDQAPATIAHGWTLDGDAIVEVMPGCGEQGDTELWLISPAGDRRRLEESPSD